MVKEMSQKIALKPKVVVLPSGEVVAKKPKKKTLSERAEQRLKDEIEIKKAKKLEKVQQLKAINVMTEMALLETDA